MCCAGLTAYRPRPKAELAQNLLSQGAGSAKEAAVQATSLADEGPDPAWISYFKPNISIALVHDATVYAANAVPPWVRSPVDLTSVSLGLWTSDDCQSQGLEIARHKQVGDRL